MNTLLRIALSLTAAVSIAGCSSFQSTSSSSTTKSSAAPRAIDAPANSATTTVADSPTISPYHASIATDSSSHSPDRLHHDGAVSAPSATYSMASGYKTGYTTGYSDSYSSGHSLAPDHSSTLRELYDPSGSSLHGRHNAAEPFDGSTNIAQVSFVTEGQCFDPDIDHTGQWMIFGSTMHRRTSDLYLKSVTGKVVTQLTTDPADDSMPAFSPDGQYIAFASNRSGNWDVFVMPVTGGQPTQVSSDPEDDIHPSWSPDGRRLVFSRLGAQSQRWEMWVVDLASPGIKHFLDYGLQPQWCPDSSQSKILFQRARQRGSRFFSVWTIDFVNGEARHPTEIVSASDAAIINPSWSPDGSRIVFVSVPDPANGNEITLPASDVWIVGIDGTGRVNLTDGQFANYQPVWSHDGKVYFVSNRSGVDNIWAMTATQAIAAPITAPAPAAVAIHSSADTHAAPPAPVATVQADSHEEHPQPDHH